MEKIFTHTYPFTQIDAFSDRPLRGNPCAIVFNAADLDDATRLAIAREMNLSETAFVVKSDVADFGARYFTPAEEIPLAGHPTIAVGYALIDSGRLKLAGDLTTISLELRVGPIRVDIRSEQGRVKQIVMSQKKPQFLRTYRAEQGHWLKRPGQAMVEVVGPRGDIETVKVGGAAVTVLRGELSLS